MTTQLSDEQLIQQFHANPGDAGQRELFDEIFRRYHARVTAWCYRYTRDREQALDLTQEVFLKAFRRFHTFRSDARISTWLYSITRNHCFDAMTRRSSELEEPMDLNSIHMPDLRAPDAEISFGRKQEQSRRLNMVRGHLNRLETVVMMLHYGHDVPIQKVTAMLALKNASGAKALIVSARRKLSGPVRALRLAS